MREARRRALPSVLLVASLVAAGCQDESEPEPGEAELGELMSMLSTDPAAGRDFFTGGDSPETDEAVDAADLPDRGRVTYLVADRSYDSDNVVDDLGAALLAATTEDLDDGAARTQVRTVLDEAVRAAGAPDEEADTIEPRLRTDLAGAAAANVRRLFGDWAAAASEQPRWSADPVRGFLIEVGHDPDGRAALEDALVAEVERRLDASAPDADPERVVDEVAVPFGRMLGALTLGAEEALDDGSSTSAGDLFDAGRDRAEDVVRTWAGARTTDQQLQTNLVGDVGGAFAAEFD